MSLNYEQFIEKFVEEFVSYLPIELRDAKVGVEHGNRTLEQFIVTIRCNGNELNLCIPVIETYSEYLDTFDFHSVLCDKADKLASKVAASSDETHIINEIFKSRDMILANICFRLVNRERNDELLSRVPHRDFMDLSMIYGILIQNKDNTLATVRITYETAEYIHLTEEELYELALVNTSKLLPASVRPITAVINELVSELDIHEEEFIDEACDENMLWVVTNKLQINGASVLAYKDTIHELAVKLNNNLYILPSSIHEVLAIQYKPSYSIKELKDMMREINETDVSPNEVLGENVYFYDKETRKLTIA